MRLDGYLTERDNDAPSGANLEYDPLFTALLLAAQPGEERQAGKEILAAEEPNYREVTEKALAVLERSHDLRAAVLLAMAQLRLNGLEGFEGPVAYIRSLLQDFWDTCHPELDADDDNDPTMRITAVLGLANTDTIIKALRLAPLAQSATLGRLNLRDLAVVDGEMPKPADMATVPDKAVIDATFRDTPVDLLRARLAAARSLLADSVAISAVFDQRTPGDGPDLDQLIRLLRKAVSKLASVVGEPEVLVVEVEESPSVADANDETPVNTASPKVSAPGEIRTSADVDAALARIIEYYARHEPSSPVPILLNRAKRLVGADFMAILRDIAPQGIDSVKVVGGIDSE